MENALLSKPNAYHSVSVGLISIYVVGLFTIGFPVLVILCLFLGGGLWAAKVIATGRLYHLEALFILLIAYTTVWGIVSGGLALSSFSNFQFYLGEGRVYISYASVLFMYAVSSRIAHEGVLRAIIGLMCFGVVMLLPLAVAGQMKPFFGSHHAAGYASGVCFLIFFSHFAKSKSFPSGLGLISSVLLLMAANSRTTMVGVLFALAFYYRSIFYTPKRLVGVFLLLVVAVYSWSHFSPSSLSRFSVIFDLDTWRSINSQFLSTISVDDPLFQEAEREGKQYNIVTRIILWCKAIWMFYQSPIFGIGNFRFNDPGVEFISLVPFVSVSVSESVSLSTATAHNSFFHILAEGGLIGLLIYVLPWMTAYIMLSKWKPAAVYSSAWRQAGAMSILFLFAGSLTGHLLVAPSAVLWVAFVVVIAIRLRSVERSMYLKSTNQGNA